MINLYYLILVHDNPRQLANLIKSLSTDNTYFYVHVDKKESIAPFREACKKENLQRVQFLVDRVKCTWGNISIVKATIALLKTMQKQHKERGYAILLSGQHYPIKSNNYIQRFFNTNYGKIYIETCPLTNSSRKFGGTIRIKNYYFFPFNRRRFITSIPRIKNFRSIFKLPGRMKMLIAFFMYFRLLNNRNHPEDLIPNIGSQWWSIPFETTLKLMEYVESRTDLLHFHRYTFAPDEMYFQTIFSSSLFAEIQNDIAQDNLVYIDWEKHNFSRPAILDQSYLSIIKNSHKLFARKFNFHPGSKIFNQIEKIRRQS